MEDSGLLFKERTKCITSKNYCIPKKEEREREIGGFCFCNIYELRSHLKKKLSI